MLLSGMGSYTPHHYHPYTLEVFPAERANHFRWAIRLNGKLLERSDRAFPSEEAARTHGAAALERTQKELRDLLPSTGSAGRAP
jgi:hypothetical protein